MARVLARLGLRSAPRPTLLLRCIVLIAAEIVVNGLLWAVAAIVFRTRPRFLSLCLLAWTLGLRHALDADHISVIDNATRRIVATTYTRQRRPVTCGLWFSLGHSTIVVAVICAIAISLGIVDRLGGVSGVGGIVGASVAGSTLFLFAVVNSVLLVQSVRASRARSSVTATATTSNANANPNANLDPVVDDNEKPPRDHAANNSSTDQTERRENDEKDHRFKGIFTRLAYPIFRLIDRPYKLYPVGVLFGLGFDTASSIALLGIAGATNTQVQDTDLGESNILPTPSADGQSTPRSDAAIVLLALLFTAGMTLVDSLDSVLMINAYAPGELLAPRSSTADKQPWYRRAVLLERRFASNHNHGRRRVVDELPSHADEPKPTPAREANQGEKSNFASSAPDQVGPDTSTSNSNSDSDSTSTSLSHALTLLSIVLAFAISTITILGLIGEHCARCTRAATKQQDAGDAGLEGSWWLFWQRANEASGIIGAGIVGVCLVAVLAWWFASALRRSWARRDAGTVQ
ncbi:NicO-domain-containing protein [Testicularia cyperi]|uniref:NicO-domain-containing protein n=1 Tax=Testicularia cyperi TaxID=1882483 RepID=A0A317XZL7_9BASI|nr:NicO-domain-containing protein [Testicularia cyperi]